MTETYDSRFFRADSRLNESRTGCGIYATASPGDIIVQDVFLPAGAVMQPEMIEGHLNILFPLVGSLMVACGGQELQLAPGELYGYAAGSGEVHFIKNSFAEETINFLHIGLAQPVSAPVLPFLSCVDITVKNCLVKGTAPADKISAGVYDSRVKDTVRAEQGSSLFLYVINGSFEAAGRLMEYRDSLLLRHMSEVEIEALSENAIILSVESSS